MQNSMRVSNMPGAVYRHVGGALLAGMCVAGLVGEAAAQAEPGLELGAGYLVVMGTMPGANAQIGFPLSDRWSLVGELNVASGRECDGCDRRFNDVSVLGGVRANWWPSRRVSVSTQVLAGGLHHAPNRHPPSDRSPGRDTRSGRIRGDLGIPENRRRDGDSLGVAMTCASASGRVQGSTWSRPVPS